MSLTIPILLRSILSLAAVLCHSHWSNWQCQAFHATHSTHVSHSSHSTTRAAPVAPMASIASVAPIAPSTKLFYVTTTTTSNTSNNKNNNNNESPTSQSKHSNSKPFWVPMELIELFTHDLQMTQEEFTSPFAGYVDVEAYTSCDDEGDALHECDFFGQYLGPTKWLHLTPTAHQSVDQIHFDIWRDVWSHPSGMVEVAEKVSMETLRYYQECVLRPHTTASPTTPSTLQSPQSPPSAPLVRVKVVPASFGLEGFEDAIWEAAEDLMKRCCNRDNHDSGDAWSAGNAVREGDAGDAGDTCQVSLEKCQAITFVVAAPDLMDPVLTQRGMKDEVMGKTEKMLKTDKTDEVAFVGKVKSPQAEFDADGFREFTDGLWEKLILFSKLEGVEGGASERKDMQSLPPLEELIELTPFHPMWSRHETLDNLKRLQRGRNRGSTGNTGSSSMCEVGERSVDSMESMESIDSKMAGSMCKQFPYPCVALSIDIEI